MAHETKKSGHDNLAPYWAFGLLVFGGTGLSTVWIDLGTFWKGYVLDMTDKHISKRFGICNDD